MVFSKTYHTNIEDYNRQGRLSLEAILRLFENIGSHHCDSVGDGVVEGSLGGHAWILTEWNIRVPHRPGYTKQFIASTWSRGKISSCTTNRDYIITDDGGKEIALGSAKFALFDPSSGKLAKISDELLSRYNPEPDKKAFDTTTLPKLREPSEYIFEKKIPLRRCDIDFNAHVHNLSYLNFALEVLPKDIYLEDNFTELRILFKKEISECEEIIAKYTTANGSHIIGIYSTDGTLHSLIQLT